MSFPDIMVWDLDYTLRDGVSGWTRMIMPTTKRGKVNLLATNNAADTSIDMDRVHQAGLSFIDHIWTPRVLKEELASSLDPQDVWIDCVPKTFLDFVSLAHTVASGSKPGRIFCTEPHASMSLSQDMYECRELETTNAANASVTIVLPDVGACAEWLCNHVRRSSWAPHEKPVVVDVGKSSSLGVRSIERMLARVSPLSAVDGLVVGDSHVDSLLARELGFAFMIVPKARPAMNPATFNSTSSGSAQS